MMKNIVVNILIGLTILLVTPATVAGYTERDPDEYGYDEAENILDKRRPLNDHEKADVEYIIDNLRDNDYEDEADELEDKYEKRKERENDKE